MRLLIGFLLTGALLLGGCDGKTPAGTEVEADGQSEDGGSDADRERARMQEIPYAGGSETDEGEEDGIDQAVTDYDRMQPGYTLYSMHMKAAARLIDERGKVVREWSDPGGRHWDNIELLPNGDLITTGADPADVSGIRDEARYAMRLTWDGQVVWKKYLLCHHDIAAAPNDELITLTFQRRKEPSIHKQIDLRDDMITRLTRDGDEIESLSLWDTLSPAQEIYPFSKTRPTSMGGRKWVDLFHCNSVEWMDDPALAEKDPLYQSSNVLFCSRHQSRVAIIDMEARKPVWAWGVDELDGPHDATVLDNGNVMIFDNGLTRGWSRVVEVDPLTNEIVWQYYNERDRQAAEKATGLVARTNDKDRAFYTKSKGSNQRLANGNTLICNSDQGEIFEVTADGDVVWRYVAPERVTRNGREMRSAYVRAYRYDRDFIEGLGLTGE